MKIKSGLLLFLLYIEQYQLILCQSDHKCEVNANKKYYDSLYSRVSQSRRRFLKENKGDSNTTQSIRITTDTSSLESLSPKQKQYFSSILESALQFLQKFLKVIPLKSNNIFTNGNEKYCFNGFKVPKMDRIIGISESDLHLYILFENNPYSEFQAIAGWCALTQTNQFIRPSFGRIKFNIAKMKGLGDDLIQYQNDISTTLHEIIHILGFTSESFPFWYDRQRSQIYGKERLNEIFHIEEIRKLQTVVVNSSTVLKVARKYYGCENLSGMQLENQGSIGSIGSHWERTILQNELMTASSLIQGQSLSVFTYALLKDTGFWDEINENLIANIYWGKNQGCDFVEKSCFSSKQYDEFPKEQTDKCNFYSDGQGKALNDYFSDKCSYLSPNQNQMCQNKSNGDADLHRKTLEDFNENSKCFVSSILNPSELNSNLFTSKTRCYQFSCSPDSSLIVVSSSHLNKFSLECLQGEQGQKKEAIYNNELIGYLTCPSNYEQFCSNQKCQNYCSFHGMCIKGMCYCNQSFGGEDCSIECNQYIEGGSCIANCSSNLFANPNKVCLSTCPKGYYGNRGVCAQCNYSCSSCTGPENNECTACQYLTYLEQGKCVEKCQEGSFQDEQSKTCQK